jgi:D-galactose 1-dehydrogenase
MATKIALCGFGKIAHDQHLPAITASPAFELVAIADPAGGDAGVPCFASLAELLAALPEVEAVAMCQPPQLRFADALTAIRAGKQVLLEKPPAPTLAAAEALVAAAAAQGTTLFAAWHSRFAPGVEPARAWLKGKSVRRATITWREDVRVWHPGQGWVWEPGGLGVFDPGINALSIATEILPRPLALKRADLSFPSNRSTPIAAALDLADSSGARVTADFDWRGDTAQRWDIDVAYDGGALTLRDGGAKLLVDGVSQLEAPDDEYPSLYRRFLELIASGRSDVDLTPLTLAADAFLLGRRIEVDAFAESA